MPPTISPREPLPTKSGDVLAEQVSKLKSLFPDCVSEGRVDFEKLRATLGGVVDDGGRYRFSWAGRAEAIRLLQTPTQATLVPDREASVNFDATGNAFIEGDNLEVLKLLLRPYFGRVKLVYIDPPYNTGQDFVYPDDYADPLAKYLQLTGQADAAGNLLTSNPETSGRYHSTWLSMMYPRLFLARQLLRDDGAIVVSIDDHEYHHLRLLMNEVFGEENFVANCIWQKVYAPKNSAKHFSEDHDYLLVYAKDAERWRPTLLPRSEEANARYENWDNDPRGEWKPGDMTARNYYADAQYEVTSPAGNRFTPSRGTYWRVNREKFAQLDADNRIWWGEKGENMPALKRFLSEVKQGLTPQTLWLYRDVGHTQEAKQELLEFVPYEDTDNVLDTVKPTRLLRRVLQTTTTPGGNDLVVDFFCGSASMAHAVLAQNREDDGDRRFLMVQLPQPLPAPESKLKRMTDIGQTRVRNVIARLHAEAADLTRTRPEDLGFRVFRLASPFVAPWNPPADADPAEYAETLFAGDRFATGWTVEGVLWECALREGFGLRTTFTEKMLPTGNTVWEAIDPDREPPDNLLRVCLDPTVRAEITKHYPLTQADTFVCRDSALDDTAAANLALQCRRLRTI